MASWKHFVNWGVFVILVGVVIAFEMIAPIRRPYDVQDPSLQYPLMRETISDFMLMVSLKGFLIVSSLE
ncbi:hypothetical protein DSO57_1016153 [Entomophthora muscae]|uniref:Uncharacterized protein n=1 Tax=Entomophthora muscae TaxID=34485 RepID=A0ACC2T4W5_9FUNG|nr:hypothetical protein DSO57_1016153 [Entomophthora muscae]